MSDHLPRVSVCVPLYCKERYVAHTIQSILNQTFSDFELVVLDNASPDRSAEIARSFDDPRIRLHSNSATVPGRENFARLVPLARADLIKMVAADDLLHPTVLERQVSILDEHPAVSLVSCRQNMIDAQGDVLYPDRSLRTSDLIGRQSRDTVVRRMVRHVGNPVGALVNVMFRRSAYDAAGGLPNAEFSYLDQAMWLAMLEYGDFYGLDETLVDFRISSESASVGYGRKGTTNQISFIDREIRRNAGVVTRSDILVNRLRTPLMRLRMALIVAAGQPSTGPVPTTARRILGLSR